MTVTTVGTYDSLQTLLQNMSQVQNDLNKDQVQISSGQVSQTFDGINGSVEQLTSLNAQVARLTDYTQSNSVITSQMQTTNTTLGGIINNATNLKGLIASQLSNTAGTASFNQQVQAALSSLTSALNTTFSGKYIFGGDNTNTAPVKSPLPSPVTVGVPDTTYYDGGTKSPQVRVADNQQITPGVRADNPAFQQLFAGITQALQANGNTTALQNAENLIDQGLQGTIAVQASVNANIVTVQQVDTQMQTTTTYYQSIASSMTSADVVSLSTKVATDQTTLEAAFSTFARISGLSLVNYLPHP